VVGKKKAEKQPETENRKQNNRAEQIVQNKRAEPLQFRPFYSSAFYQP
jgi:hypothetical protein